MDKNASDGAARGYWIDDWNPEDEPFWKATGKRIARRNLIWSILAENIGFSVWLMWSVVGDATCPRSASTTRPTSCSRWWRSPG